MSLRVLLLLLLLFIYLFYYVLLLITVLQIFILPKNHLNFFLDHITLGFSHIQIKIVNLNENILVIVLQTLAFVSSLCSENQKSKFLTNV